VIVAPPARAGGHARAAMVCCRLAARGPAGRASAEGQTAIDTALRRTIASRAELAQALLELAGRARRAVRCCSYDAAVFALDAAPLVAALDRLARDSRGARVQVLVEDPLWIETRAPRFKAMRRRLCHAVQVRAASDQDPLGDTVLWLVDDRHGLLLEPGPIVAGELWFDHQQFVRPMLAEFDRRWAAAAHDLPVVPLGL